MRSLFDWHLFGSGTSNLWDVNAQKERGTGFKLTGYILSFKQAPFKNLAWISAAVFKKLQCLLGSRADFKILLE